MRKYREWNDKVRCGFIGWNYNLLSQCGEASHRLLKIYSSAVLIIMILWFVIGSVFSQRYIGVTSYWRQLLTGAAFALIVYFIERIIILHMGGKGIYAFRTVLAICMAILGAFIFDQMIFRNDLEEAIRTEERSKIKKEYQEKLTSAHDELAKIKIENDSLNAEINLHPYVIQTDVETTTSNQVDSLGNKQKQTTISRRQVPNPLNEQVRFNNDRIQQYQIEIMQYRNANIDEEVDIRIKNKKTGFLEELKASVSVIFETWISTIFYAVMTLVLLCLELFVVSLKFFKSKKCEYDLIVEHQLNAKTIQLQNQWRELNRKYVTKTLECTSENELH